MIFYVSLLRIPNLMETLTRKLILVIVVAKKQTRRSLSTERNASDLSGFVVIGFDKNGWFELIFYNNFPVFIYYLKKEKNKYIWAYIDYNISMYIVIVINHIYIYIQLWNKLLPNFALFIHIYTLLLGNYDDGDCSYISEYCQACMWFGERVNKRFGTSTPVFTCVVTVEKLIFHFLRNLLTRYYLCFTTKIVHEHIFVSLTALATWCFHLHHYVVKLMIR